MRNNGEAGFSDETKRFPFVAGRALDAVRFDLEPDTPGFDLVVSYADRPGVLYRDRLGGTYEAVPLNSLPSNAHGLVAMDVDDDGYTDLEFEPAGRLLNRAGDLQAVPPVPRAFPAASAAADFTGTGRLDVARIGDDGSLVVAHDVTAAYGNWIEVTLTGVKNARLSVNAKVEVKAGTSYQKMTDEGVPLLFRLGSRTSVDTIRITWPNALIQNEMKKPVNRVMVVKEAPRLAGSCPMIFTWNGQRFQFVTDVLGVAPLGASSGDGQYFPVDHDEYVSIPGATLQAHDGAFEVRMTEELREVSYIDQIKLLSLDHPAGTEIVTNEKFKSPPFPEFRLYGSNRRTYPTSARDTVGTDVRAALLARDRRYPIAFQRDSAGVAELHTLDLNFAGAAPDGKAVLVLYGWVDWADGSTFRGRDSSPSRPGVSLSPGQRCAGELEDRRRRYGDALRQAEDHGSGPQRQVPLGVARGADRDQSVRLLGRDLPVREQCSAADTSRGNRDDLRGFAFSGLFARHYRCGAQAAGILRLPGHQFDFDVEPDARKLYALRLRARTCCGNRTIAWSILGSGDEIRMRFRRCRPARVAGWLDPRLPAAGGWLG